MQIQIAIEGVTQLSRRLNNIAESSRDWTPALKQSAEDLISTFSGPVFETEGAEIDEHWSPLKKAYAKRKEAKYPGAGILEATGNMRYNFKSKVDATSAKIWNAMTYFKYHQSKEPRTKLPRRVIMKLTNNLKEVVVKNFQSYFIETVAK